MELKKIYEVDENIVNDVWKNQLEIETRQNIIKYLIQTNPNKDLINEYLKELSVYKMAYEKSKKAVSDYLKPMVNTDFKNIDSFNWNLDFCSRKATISFE